MKITAYTILSALQDNTLEVLVMKAIAEGWQPLGGVAMLEIADDQEIGGCGKIVAQAMVRYEESPVERNLPTNLRGGAPYSPF